MMGYFNQSRDVAAVKILKGELKVSAFFILLIEETLSFEERSKLSYERAQRWKEQRQTEIKQLHPALITADLEELIKLEANNEQRAKNTI